MTDNLLPPAPPLEGVSLGQVMADVMQRLDLLLGSRLLCVPCAVTRDHAVASGADPADLPPVNIANVIVEGTSQCLAHARTPVTPPGQTAAGLILP